MREAKRNVVGMHSHATRNDPEDELWTYLLLVGAGVFGAMASLAAVVF